jgi:hypothetical protein
MQSTLHRLPLPQPSGDPHSIAHFTHSVSSPKPSPSTQCPHDASNQPHSRHGAFPPDGLFTCPRPLPARTRVFDPYGAILVDEDEDSCSEIVLVPGGRFLLTEHGGLSLWDLGLNTEGAHKMTMTTPIAVHASEDGSKLLILGVVPAPDCRASGLRVVVGNRYVPSCVMVRQMLMACRSMSISVSEIHPAVPKPQYQFIRRLCLKVRLIYVRFLAIAWSFWMMRCIPKFGISVPT